MSGSPTLDRVRFSSSARWPTQTSVGGAALQVIDPFQDNAPPGNWTLATPRGDPRPVLSLTSNWRFFEAGTPPTGWNGTTFNDASWRNGSGLYFVETANLPAPKTTALTLGQWSCYFRTTFILPQLPSNPALTLTHVIDDGAVFHLNGSELAWCNFNAGTVIGPSTRVRSLLSPAHGRRGHGTPIHSLHPAVTFLVRPAFIRPDMHDPHGIQPWTRLASTPAGNFRIFTVRSDAKIHPRTGSEHDFYVIDCVNWANACAITPDRHLVMIEQYRHGSDTLELEVPGGMLDPHESDPMAGAVRELREETGYTGTRARIIGEMFPNAAIMSNRCHTVLVENATLTHSTEFDPSEDIRVRLVPLDEVPHLVARGVIRHAIVLAALHHLDLWQRGFME